MLKLVSKFFYGKAPCGNSPCGSSKAASTNGRPSWWSEAYEKTRYTPLRTKQKFGKTTMMLPTETLLAEDGHPTPRKKEGEKYGDGYMHIEFFDRMNTSLSLGIAGLRLPDGQYCLRDKWAHELVCSIKDGWAPSAADPHCTFYIRQNSVIINIKIHN
eukprot:TRINITY_DN60693_c0_g1_i1.p1 TRINITY_DN60693_c0_g1~~TRINITY_DN60693_c0_g1_i1.p1  ORF type:complete len:158 (-),score=13.23 TRINITY_DN60693_c0_g1_i1:44-517(-)